MKEDAGARAGVSCRFFLCPVCPGKPAVYESVYTVKKCLGLCGRLCGGCEVIQRGSWAMSSLDDMLANFSYNPVKKVS